MASSSSSSSSSSSHGKDKACHISQCVKAVRELKRDDGDPDALYCVATSPCSCGFKWPACSLPLHAQAVDTLCECLEKAEKHVAAFSTALGLIRLDPASAIGYCRVAKILKYLAKQQQQQQQQQQNTGNPNVARSAVAVIVRDAKLASADKLRDLIHLFVRAGLHNAEKYRPNGPVDRYRVILNRMAHSLNLAESRRDPLKKLPMEIARMVFACLSTSELCTCVQVSSRWNQIIMADKMLWTDVRLLRPKNPGRHLVDFIRKRRGIQTLVIGDINGFGLGIKKLLLLGNALENLERLVLSGDRPLTQLKHDPGEPLPQFNKLKQLSIRQVAEWNFNLVGKLVTNVAWSLEVLDFFVGIAGTRTVDRFPCDHLISTTFPRLKKLRLVYDVHKQPQYTQYLHMRYLVRYTPVLEELYLDGFSIPEPRGNELDWRIGSEDVVGWPSLHSVTFGEHMCVQPDAQIGASRCFPPLRRGLRKLEILTTDLALTHHILTMRDHRESESDPESTGSEASLELPSLQIFRCRTSVQPTLLQEVLKPAIDNGSLKVLELAIQPTGFSFPRFMSHAATYPIGVTIPPNTTRRGDPVPLEDFAWAASDHVHTIGLYGFNWSDGGSGGSGFDGQPMIEWIDKCFPNAETLVAYPGKYANTAPFIMGLICLRPGVVKTVHQDCLVGVEWDEAQKLAKKNGVRLCHTPKYVAAGWPVVEER